MFEVLFQFYSPREIQVGEHDIYIPIAQMPKEKPILFFITLNNSNKNSVDNTCQGEIDWYIRISKLIIEFWLRVYNRI